MKLTSRDFIVVLFIGISLLSLGYILFAASNYNNYYWQARAAILDAGSNNTLVRTVGVTKQLNTGGITIRVSVSATNPTGFSGLILARFDIVLYFLHNGNFSQSVFATPSENLLTSSVLDRPLGPQSTVSTDVFVNLDTAQSTSFKMFNQTYNGNVDAHVLLTTTVDSFFDPVYGMITTVKEQQIATAWY